MQTNHHIPRTMFHTEFMQRLTPIRHFESVPSGTKIYHQETFNPLNYDIFLEQSTLLGESVIYFKKQGDERRYHTTLRGWFLWDRETAYEVLSSSISLSGRPFFTDSIIAEDEEAINYCLKHDAQLTVLDGRRRPPFSYAASCWNVNLCKQLYHKTIAHYGNLLDGPCASALHDATFDSHVVPESQRDAKRKAFLETVEFLLEIGFPANQPDNDGFSPLLDATNHDFAQLDVIQKLVESGADVNYTNHIGKNALFYATQRDEIEITAYLLKNRANVNLVDTMGKRAVESIHSLAMIEVYMPYVDQMDGETEGFFRGTALKVMMEN